MQRGEAVREHPARRKALDYHARIGGDALRLERRPRLVDHREQLEIEPREIRTLRRQHIAIECMGVDLPAGGGPNERWHEEDDVQLVRDALPLEPGPPRVALVCLRV